MRRVQRVKAGMVLAVLAAALTSSAFAQEYTIAPQDILDISVLGEPGLSGLFPVSPDGKIALPLAGQVTASGLTLPQLTQKLSAELRQYVRDPQVTISVRQTAPHRRLVYLVGQVTKPGAYEMEDGWTIAGLVAVAGGPTPAAALPRVLIVRKDTTVPVNLEKLLVEGDPSANVSLEPGDVVIVPETTERIVVMGAVAKPGPYIFKPGDRIVDVLSLAGGPSGDAVINEVGVIRQTGAAKPIVTPVNLEKFYKDGDMSQNIPLRSGDIVYVPQRAGINWSTVLSGLGFLVYLIK